jgi:hypothetical protein
MAFVLPNFNLTVNIWRAGSGYGINPPDVVTVGNLTPGKRVLQSPLLVSLPIGPTHQYNLGIIMELLLPAGTDIQPFNPVAGGTGADAVEAPAGSGKYYMVLAVDDVGKGFANEHVLALMVRATPGAQLLVGNSDTPP